MKKKKKKNLTQIIGLSGLGILIAGLVLSVVLQNVSLPVDNAEFIFAGTEEDADCSIFLSNGSCVVIDAGESTDADHIVRLLKKNGVSEIDYLIITHPDKDHIGSVTALLEKFSLKSIVTPYYGQFNAAYSEILKKAEALNVRHETVTDVVTLKAGDLKMTVYPPHESFYEIDNEYSLVVSVNHGDVNLLMTGDIEKQRIAEMENVKLPKISLMKVPYHGRSSNASADYIRRVSPKFAIVNAASPESKIEKALNKLGIQYYCTVGRDVYFTSDGKNLSFSEVKELN